MEFATGWTVARLGRAARWAIGVAAALVALGALLVVGARLWVGSERGRRTVERKVDDVVARRLGGHARVGRISGSLVGGVTLDEVEWRDTAGRVGAKARRVVARWSAARTLAKRPAIELRVEGAELDADRLLAADLETAAQALAEERDKVESLTVTRLEVIDSTVRAGGRTLRVARLDGSGRLDKGAHLGDRGELALQRLEAAVELGGVRWALGGGGALRWDRPAGVVEAERLRLRAGESSAVITSGRFDPDGADVRLASLRLAPADLRRLSPRAEAPRTPLRGDGRAHGPWSAVRVDGQLFPDAGSVRLDGVIDLERRRGVIQATLADVEADYTPAVLAGRMTLRGRVDGAARVLFIAWSGDGHYFRREVDPNLQTAALSTPRRRAFAAVRPGGRFHAAGRLRAEFTDAPTASMRFRVRIDDPGQAARIVAGPDLRDAPRPLLLDGRWRVDGSGPATLTLKQY